MATVTQFSIAGRGLARRSHERKFPQGRNDICAQSDGADGDYDRPLSALIEREIIPRLMAAHSSDAQPFEASATIGAIHGGTIQDKATHDRVVRDRETHDREVYDSVIQAAEIDAFAPLVMQVDADVLLAHIEAILDRGITVDAVMVDLLAPAARLLGEYWDDDRCDFIDVTMGLWRLQEVVYEIAGRLPARAVDADAEQRRRALFVSLRGDQHSLGTVVIEEVFRSGGWLTDRINDAETVELLDAAAGDWFDMIGLTITCDCNIGDLTSTIAALRKVSHNPRIQIMVGGALFSADPGLATQVGADGTAGDARLALIVADNLLREFAAGASACS